ncbi:MAG: PD-(D/E)XK nuclease domain-containing protein [Fibromonadaceae bacterium]|jgi:hypothetical protein|nr:PD-(D/E)XK nuclease domain-containing protein [Fibromonadaceae bacterium]
MLFTSQQTQRFSRSSPAHFLGFDVRSNNAAGFGRYDLFIESEKWTAVMEFKVSKTARGVKEAIKDALVQIEKEELVNEF